MPVIGAVLTIVCAWSIYARGGAGLLFSYVVLFAGLLVVAVLSKLAWMLFRANAQIAQRNREITIETRRFNKAARRGQPGLAGSPLWKLAEEGLVEISFYICSRRNCFVPQARLRASALMEQFDYR